MFQQHVHQKPTFGKITNTTVITLTAEELRTLLLQHFGINPQLARIDFKLQSMDHYGPGTAPMEVAGVEIRSEEDKSPVKPTTLAR